MTRVYVFKRPDSRYFQMKWMDPDGKWLRESTRTTKRAEAKDVAADKRKELKYQENISLHGIGAFRDRYETEFLAGKSKSHRDKFRNTINSLERLVSPELISEIDGPMIADWAGKMRAESTAEATIDSYLGYLQRALNWTVKAGMLQRTPLIERLHIPDEGAAKGRPLTLEEVERLEMQCAATVGVKAAPSFLFLIRGLRLSGLRLGEAMKLWWRDGDSNRIIVQVGAFVTLAIPGRSQKNRRRQVYPVVPAFEKYLLSVPPQLRKGPVFNPLNMDGKRFDRVDTVSKRIAKMGELAGIIVKHDDETGGVTFASAQDLRRTFGLKWAKRVKSIELKALMRHADIKTTEKYYAIENANDAAASLHDRFGHLDETENEIAKELSVDRAN